VNSKLLQVVGENGSLRLRQYNQIRMQADNAFEIRSGPASDSLARFCFGRIGAIIGDTNNSVEDAESV